VKASPVERMRKKRFCHKARRRLPAKANSQLRDMIKTSKRIQVMRRTFPRQFDEDATKTEKKAKP